MKNKETYYQAQHNKQIPFNSQDTRLNLSEDLGGTRSTLTSNELAALKKSAEEGWWAWKAAGFIACCCMIALGAMNFSVSFSKLEVLRCIVHIYIMLSGFFFGVLEYKEYAISQKCIAFLKKEAKLFTRPYGRAICYFLAGILLACEDGLIGLFIGSFIAFTGIVIFFSSRTAHLALMKVKNRQFSEESVNEIFDKHDIKKDGELDIPRLKYLIEELGGSTLSSNELESALLILDKNADNKISKEEFALFWKDNDVF